MNPPRNIERICMRVEASTKRKSSCNRKTFRREIGEREKKLTKREVNNLFFDNCEGCLTMAAIPHGAFAARKVRENNERRFLISKMEKKGGNNDKDNKQDTGYSKKNAKEEGRELTPLKYNSKLMNSIWGLYNRYSVHNFKKNTDADDVMNAAARWGSAVLSNRPPATSTSERTAAAQVHKFLRTGNARL